MSNLIYDVIVEYLKEDKIVMKTITNVSKYFFQEKDGFIGFYGDDETYWISKPAILTIKNYNYREKE